MMVVKECALCGKKQKIRLLYPESLKRTSINTNSFSARRIPDRTHYQINRCQKCGLIFSSPVFSEEEINSLYKKSDMIYDNLTKFLSRTYFSYLKPALPKNKDLSLLDVGCGDGFFLKAIQELTGLEVWGIEPSQKAIKKAASSLRTHIKNDVLRKGVFSQANFNIVTCFHTLDHVVDPNEFLKVARGLLKKGGFAFFVVHDSEGLSVQLFGEKSPIFDIEHIYLFNKKTLRKLFKNNGFKRVEVFDIKNTYPLSYWIKMTPLPKSIKIPLINLFQKPHLNNLSCTLGAGNIGILAWT